MGTWLVIIFMTIRNQIVGIQTDTITKSKFRYRAAFAFGCVVKINLMVGYGLYDIADDISTYFAGEIGLYYAF
jgi:hypothetical protein